MLADIVNRGLLTARGVVGFWRANSKVLATLWMSLDCKSIPSSLLRATMSWCSTTLERIQQRSTVSGSRWLKTWEKRSALVTNLSKPAFSIKFSSFAILIHFWRLRKSWTPVSPVFQTSLHRRWQVIYWYPKSYILVWYTKLVSYILDPKWYIGTQSW